MNQSFKTPQLISLCKKEEYINSLQNIYSQANRLGILTESLLKLTQTGYDGQKQLLDVVRIDELLLEVKSDLNKIYPDNRVTLKLNKMPSDESQLLIPCNKSLLELSINNIITNGVKYSNNEEVWKILEQFFDIFKRPNYEKRQLLLVTQSKILTERINSG